MTTVEALVKTIIEVNRAVGLPPLDGLCDKDKDCSIKIAELHRAIHRN